MRIISCAQEHNPHNRDSIPGSPAWQSMVRSVSYYFGRISNVHSRVQSPVNSQEPLLSTIQWRKLVRFGYVTPLPHCKTILQGAVAGGVDTGKIGLTMFIKEETNVSMTQSTNRTPSNIWLACLEGRHSSFSLQVPIPSPWLPQSMEWVSEWYLKGWSHLELR